MVNKFRIKLMFSLLIFYVFENSTVFAAVPIPDKPGADIIILMDQSGSMSGRNKGSTIHPEPNDEHGYRIDAIRILINKLEAESKHSIARGQPSSYRIAMIEFGSDAHQLIPWTLIESDPSQKSTFKSYVQLKAVLEEKNMGNTHFLAAFKQVNTLFHDIQFGKDTIYDRKLAIFLITDGQPYTEAPQYFRNKRFYINSYWKDLKQNIQKTKQEAKDMGRELSLYVLALNDAVSYWESAGPIWEELSKKTRKLEINYKLPLYIEEIIKDLIDIKYIVVQDQFDCPCYLSKVHFIIYQKDPGTTIQIYKPDGQQVDMNKFIVERGNTYIVYGFNSPEKGIWKIDGYKNTDIRVEKYYDQVEFISPGIDQKVPKIPIKIRWAVTSSKNGDPFTAKTGCPYRVETIIKTPDKKTQKIEMKLAQNGIFESVKDFNPEIHGTYKIQLIGYSPTVKSGEQPIFEGAEQPFEVTDVKPLLVTLVEPESISLRFGKTDMQFKIKITDFKDPTKLLNLSDISTSPDKLISIQILNDEDEVVGVKTFFKPDNKSGTNIFSANVKIKDRFRPLNSILRKGKMKIVFLVNQEFLNPKYIIYRIKES